LWAVHYQAQKQWLKHASGTRRANFDMENVWKARLDYRRLVECPVNLE